MSDFGGFDEPSKQRSYIFSITDTSKAEMQPCEKSNKLTLPAIGNLDKPVASLTTAMSVGEPSPDRNNTHDTILL